MLAATLRTLWQRYNGRSGHARKAHAILPRHGPASELARGDWSTTSIHVDDRERWRMSNGFGLAELACYPPSSLSIETVVRFPKLL
jgi:hypothetical protein